MGGKKRGKNGSEKGKAGSEDPDDEFRPPHPMWIPITVGFLMHGGGGGMLHPALIQPVPTPATKGTHTKGSLGGLAPKMS